MSSGPATLGASGSSVAAAFAESESVIGGRAVVSGGGRIAGMVSLRAATAAGGSAVSAC